MEISMMGRELVIKRTCCCATMEQNVESSFPDSSCNWSPPRELERAELINEFAA